MKKMKFLIATLVALLFIGGFANADQRPNIVMIISDDQAWTDYGFMGHPDIQTPHLDSLAKRSLLMERGYVAAPLCRPSLASMVTGLYPFQHGITGNDVDGLNNREAFDVPLRTAFHQHPSLIKTLVDSGYLAHQSGKWWEGSWQDGGFTHGMTHGDSKRGGRHGDAGLKIGREGLEPVTDFIDTAVAADKPFLVWYAPFLPHTPHNPPQRLLKQYTNSDLAPDVAKYYATCEWFDETCGQLLGYLDRKKIADNTMVVYICDNGWAAPSTNGADPNQKLWKNYAQRSKSSPYENGIRTPIMISWPSKVAPKRVPEFAHAIDLFPTIAAATGVAAPENLPGVDLLNSSDREARKRVFGVCNSTHNTTIGNPDETLQYLWSIEDKWKLLVRYHGVDTTKYHNLHVWDTAKYRLYNLAEDPHERDDLAAKHPEVVGRLQQAIKNWHHAKVQPERQQVLLGGKSFLLGGRHAFLMEPVMTSATGTSATGASATGASIAVGGGKPWIFYGATLPRYPDQAESWMHRQFLDAGIAVAGIDVGEAYGSPHAFPHFEALYQKMVKDGYSKRPALLGRSRGGLWVSSWAIKHPDRVAGIGGIYPCYDYTTYPGLQRAAPAYGVSEQVLAAEQHKLNPIKRAGVLADAKIPVFIIHGRDDKVVPLAENSAALEDVYKSKDAGGLIEVIKVDGQGHSFWPGYFQCQELVDFLVDKARSK
jgi:arylsulfatase A-like enzyme